MCCLFVNSVGVVNSLTLNLVLRVRVVLWPCLFVLVGLCVMVVLGCGLRLPLFVLL